MNACHLTTMRLSRDQAHALITFEKDTSPAVTFHRSRKAAETASAIADAMAVGDIRPIPWPSARRSLCPWLAAPRPGNPGALALLAHLAQSSDIAEIVPALNTAIGHAIATQHPPNPPAKIILNAPHAMNPARLNFTHAYLAMFPEKTRPPLACNPIDRLHPRAHATLTAMAGHIGSSNPGDLDDARNLVVTNIAAKPPSIGRPSIKDARNERRAAFDTLLERYRAESASPTSITIHVPAAEIQSLHSALLNTPGSPRARRRSPSWP